VVRLTNPWLRQLKVPGRTESLREDELIHSPASQYPGAVPGRSFCTITFRALTASPGALDLPAKEKRMCSLETAVGVAILRMSTLQHR
jgi:hypothetical protein